MGRGTSKVIIIAKSLLFPIVGTEKNLDKMWALSCFHKCVLIQKRIQLVTCPQLSPSGHSRPPSLQCQCIVQNCAAERWPQHHIPHPVSPKLPSLSWRKGFCGSRVWKVPALSWSRVPKLLLLCSQVRRPPWRRSRKSEKQEGKMRSSMWASYFLMVWWWLLAWFVGTFEQLVKYSVFPTEESQEQMLQYGLVQWPGASLLACHRPDLAMICLSQDWLEWLIHS